MVSRVFVLDEGRPGTSIDLQLDLNKVIDVAVALEGYVPVNLRLEAREDPQDDVVTYLVKDQPEGSGTRLSGAAVRNRILNTLREGVPVVRVDFRGSRISSSFADEVVGMLVVELGFFEFQRRIELENLDQVGQAIMHSVVGRRMVNGMREHPQE